MRQANYIKSGSMVLFTVRTLVRALRLSAKAGTLLGAGLALAPAPGWCGTPQERLSNNPRNRVSLEMKPEKTVDYGKETRFLNPENQYLTDADAVGRSERAQSPATPPSAGELDLPPEVIEGSPVLQRWLRQVPNVWQDIENDPSFKTRVRLGFSQFPSAGGKLGWNAGVEDVFVGRTGLTVSGDYQGSFNGETQAYGAQLRYYMRPLGSYINVAPVVGYRHLETDFYSRGGVNVGARLLLALSRGGAADISLTQSWVKPGTDEEVGLTAVSVGYAVTRHLRLSADIEKQNARESKDSRVGIVLEWVP